MEKIEQLRTWVQESHRIVAFTGAGVSTESGVPDFRGENGLYKEWANSHDSTELCMLVHSFERKKSG